MAHFAQRILFNHDKRGSVASSEVIRQVPVRDEVPPERAHPRHHIEQSIDILQFHAKLLKPLLPIKEPPQGQGLEIRQPTQRQ
jgi:hypothetical protein